MKAGFVAMSFPPVIVSAAAPMIGMARAHGRCHRPWHRDHRRWDDGGANFPTRHHIRL